jgi:hypothetical protein
MHLVKKCTKPDRKEFTAIASHRQSLFSSWDSAGFFYR